MAIDIRRVRSEFVLASKQTAAELGIKAKCITYDMPHRKDSDFSWVSFSEEKLGAPSFQLSLDQESHPSVDGGWNPSVELTLYIKYEEHGQPFEMRYTFENPQINLDIIGWTTWVLHSFNLKYHPLNLEGKFLNSPLRVYGSSDSHLETLAEFQLLMRGLRACESDVIVLKLRHVDPVDWMRSYSYAIWAEPRYAGIWVFFLNAAGLDTRGGKRDLAIIEKLIRSLEPKRVSVTTYDVSLRMLESFLARTHNDFRRFDSEFSAEYSQRIALNDGEDPFGTEITDSLRKATDSFWSRDYPGALRDLRAVVQDALELLAQKESVNLKEIDKPNINRIAHKLADENVLDGRLVSWFDCFASFANVASHGNFPNEEEWKDMSIRSRVLATFIIGRQLLVEMKHHLMDAY